MGKKIIVVLLVSLTLGSVRFAEAQQSKKVPRIGYLSATSPSANVARIEAFRQGLCELGYVEGKNIVIEWRFCRGEAGSTLRAHCRVSESQGRSHRHGWWDSNPCRQRNHCHGSRCHGFDNDPVGSGF